MSYWALWISPWWSWWASQVAPCPAGDDVDTAWAAPPVATRVAATADETSVVPTRRTRDDMCSFPLLQRGGVPRRGNGTHPLRSSTACVRDASERVFRLT